MLLSCDVCLCLCCLLLSQVVAVSGPFRPVSGSAAVVLSGGAVAAERSPPVCEGELRAVSSPAVLHLLLFSLSVACGVYACITEHM